MYTHSSIFFFRYYYWYKEYYNFADIFLSTSVDTIWRRRFYQDYTFFNGKVPYIIEDNY